MKKLIKIAGIVVGVILVLLIAVFVLAKFLITPERVRSTVLPIAERNLQREITLGDIEISLFSGIVLEDLTVKEKEGRENILAADEVELRYRFWPLFFLKVVVDEIRLEDPEIRVVRNSDGTFNFSDLLTAGEEKKPAAAPPPEKTEAGPAINLLVADLTVSEGELVFLDQAVDSRAPFRYEIDDLAVRVSDLALDRSFPYSVTADLQGAPLKIKGEINLQGPRGAAEITLSDFDVTAFSPYFQKSLPGKLASLNLGCDFRVEGDLEKVSSKGSIVLENIDLTLDALQDAPVREAGVSLDYDLAADLQAALLKISSAAVDLNGIKVEASGAINDYSSDPGLDLTVKLPETELPAFMAAVPESLVKGVSDLKPAGRVSAAVNLSGSLSGGPDEMLKQGMVELASVRAGKEGLRPEISGRIDLQGDSLTSSGLSLQIGDNRADIDLRAANLFGRPVQIKSSITSERFAIDPLLQAASVQGAAGREKAGKDRSGKGGAEVQGEPGPFAIPVKADGKVLVDTALYKGLTVKNFDLAYRLEDNVLTVDHLTGQVAGGNFSKTATVDLGRKGLNYEADVHVRSVQANPFVSAFYPKASDTVFGELFLDLKAHGQGVQTEAIKKSLSGKGEIRLLDGKITGAGLVEGLAGYLDLQKLRVLRFSRFKGEYTIDKGRLRINTDFTGSDLRMHPTGTVGLDGSLDLSLDARLSPEYAGRLDEKGTVTQYLKDEEGWALLPLKVTGTLNDPGFSLDTTAVRQKLKEKAAGEVKKKFQEEVLDKLAPEEGKEEGTGGDDPAKKMLRDTIEGILGN